MQVLKIPSRSESRHKEGGKTYPNPQWRSNNISTINPTNLAYFYLLPYYQDHNAPAYERLYLVSVLASCSATALCCYSYTSIYILTWKVHLNLIIYLARNQRFTTMSDRGDAVLLECGYDARLGAVEDSPAEWCGSCSDTRCDDLDNFCLHPHLHIRLVHL